MINRKNIEKYLRGRYGKDLVALRIRKLGSGVQGAGFLVRMETGKGDRSYVIKGLFPEGLEHDYPSDRAGVFLLDLDEFGNLPRHVKALDVLAERKDGSIRSIGGGREYYLLMEKASGRDYFCDLRKWTRQGSLTGKDRQKIEAMTSYLAEIHALKKEARHLYWRKVRDTVGHGECLMGVFDTYPDGTMSYEEMAGIEKKCVDWRARLKAFSGRLCQVHGDFHPGNIWFRRNADFVLLDRSRGPWGEAADDITALTINYIFFSVLKHGKVRGPYREALRLFYDLYLAHTGDADLFRVVAPFYAFRGAVVANPVFYPDVTKKNRKKIINFVHAVLDDAFFQVEKVNDYLS